VSVLRATFVFAAAAAIASCGQLNGVSPERTSLASIASFDALPPACKDQRTAKKYAQITTTLKTAGGSFCIPEFRGYGGTMEYPGVERSVPLTLRSSMKNIYNQPQLGSGSAIFYLNLHFLAGTHFGTQLKSKGGLTAAAIEPGQPYTAFGIVAVGHLLLMFPPCYAIATQGPYGGVFPNIGNLFSAATITGAGYGVIEIYPGEQVTQAC
jgi:hypothetical protein